MKITVVDGDHTALGLACLLQREDHDVAYLTGGTQGWGLVNAMRPLANHIKAGADLYVLNCSEASQSHLYAMCRERGPVIGHTPFTARLQFDAAFQARTFAAEDVLTPLTERYDDNEVECVSYIRSHDRPMAIKTNRGVVWAGTRGEVALDAIQSLEHRGDYGRTIMEWPEGLDVIIGSWFSGRKFSRLSTLQTWWQYPTEQHSRCLASFVPFLAKGMVLNYTTKLQRVGLEKLASLLQKDHYVGPVAMQGRVTSADVCWTHVFFDWRAYGMFLESCRQFGDALAGLVRNKMKWRLFRGVFVGAAVMAREQGYEVQGLNPRWVEHYQPLHLRKDDQRYFSTDHVPLFLTAHGADDREARRRLERELRGIDGYSLYWKNPKVRMNFVRFFDQLTEWGWV